MMYLGMVEEMINEMIKEIIKEIVFSMQKEVDLLREVDDIIKNSQEEDLSKEANAIISSKQKEIELKEVDEIINDSFKTATFGNRSNSSSLTQNNEPNYSRRTDNTRNQLDMEMSRRRPVLSSQSQNEPESQSQDSIGAYLDEIADVDLYSNMNQSQ